MVEDVESRGADGVVEGVVEFVEGVDVVLEELVFEDIVV